MHYRKRGFCLDIKNLGKNPISTDKHKYASQINKEPAKDITPFDIKEGQILKGEVVDLRYDSVTIRLEPGNQIVVAKLEGAVDLSIGQTAEFYVAEDGSNRIVLRYLPIDGASTNITIDKALTVSNIPLTNRNKVLVSDLLANQMPIDKNTLATLVRLSHIHHETTPLTLVLMYKYNIPMTKENIQQFKAYQNGSNEIIGKINTLSNSLLELIDNTDTNQQLLQLNKDLLQLLDSNINTNPKYAQFTPHVPINNIISKEDSSISEAISYSLEFLGLERNSVFPLSINTLHDIVADPSFTSLPEAIRNLIIKYVDNDIISSNSPEIINILNQDERTELIRLLTPFSDTDQLDNHGIKQSDNMIDNHIVSPILRQIESGEAPIKDVLSYIKQNITNSDLTSNGVYDIIQSPVYIKLLQAVIKDRWTITPEKLDQYSVSQLYENLDEDIKYINNMLQLSEDSTEMMKLHEPSKGLQDNLSFLKDLNQIFNYLPLPIQFKNQEAHCDLYVLTKKKASHDPSNGLSVLLHLDMEHLGSLNIRLNMKSKHISGKFYIEDLSSVQLISSHMETLVDSLKKKGYDFVPEIISSYEKPDFTKDFIANELKDNDFSRYTFDVRT